MGEISQSVLFNVVVFLAFPLLAGMITIKLRLPSIVGYIFGGILLGSFFGSTVSGEFLSHVAGMGIIYLLFIVGLETNLSSVKRFGKFVLVGGLLQIFITSFVLAVLLMYFNFSLTEAFFFGAVLSLSSTAAVAKVLQDKGEEDTLHGQLAIGLLIVQDLAAIPMIIIVSSVANFGGGFSFILDLALTLLKATGVLLLMYILGKKLVPFVFNKVARISREILNILTIFFIFAMVYLFSYIGLSASIAAFISGILIGQTREQHHIFSQIRPLRDIFAMLFFVFLGASLNLTVFFDNFLIILAISAFLIFIKTFVVLVIFLLLKFHTRTSFFVALSLFQVGEFAFIIINQAVGLGLVSGDHYQLLLPSVIISLTFTPYFIIAKAKLYGKLKKFLKKRLPALEHYVDRTFDRDLPHIEAIEIKNHVVICGYGRLGRYIGRALLWAKIPFIAIDYNFHAVEHAKNQGVKIIYGDSTEADILDYAQCEHAAVLISAVPEKFSQQSIVINAKRLNPRIVIFTRIRADQDQRYMKDLGAEVVIQPEFEAAIAIIKKILLAFNVTKEEISGKVKRLKIEHGMSDKGEEGIT